MGLRIIVLAVIALGASAACEHLTQGYCLNAEKHECLEPRICEASGHTCVDCTAEDPGACAAGMTCHDNQCVCTKNEQCDSGVCLDENGSCVSPASVAFVRDGSAADECTRGSPCSLAQALARGTPYVVVIGKITSALPIVIAGDTHVTIVGNDESDENKAGVVLASPNKETSAFEISGHADVTLRDLGVSNAKGTGIRVKSADSVGPAVALTRVTISHSGIGIEQLGGTLTVEKCTLDGNEFGAMANTGSFTLANSLVRNSGEDGVVLGVRDENAIPPVAQIIGNQITNSGTAGQLGTGLWIRHMNSQSLIEFNTVASNLLTPRDDALSGVACEVTTTVGRLRNNIVSTSRGHPFEPSCNYSYTVVYPEQVTGTGTGNISIDPAFRDAAQGDFHLRPDSPAHCRADPATDLRKEGHNLTDLDGNARRLPADPGAYTRPADVTCSVAPAR